MSPETIAKISEGHIDESWAKMLTDIDRRAAAHEKRASSRQTKASEDLGPLLEKLIAKVARITPFTRPIDTNVPRLSSGLETLSSLKSRP